MRLVRWMSIAALIAAASLAINPIPSEAKKHPHAKATPTVKATKEWVRGGESNSNTGSSGTSNSTSGTQQGWRTRSSAPNNPPQGVDSKGEPCDPRKDADCDSLMNSVKPVTDTDIREVAAQLKLPNPTPRFGPDPSVNEWKMLAVGFPIWLWTDRPTTVSTTAHHDGLTFTLTATWTSTTFTMGDGHSKTCTATTIRPKQVKPATKPSPTCSYTYQTKSKIGHPYTVTANTHWRINWTTNGYQGTFNHTYTGSRTLTIGELQSLING